MEVTQFFYWLKGFSEAVNPYNVTPAQWDIILEKLNQVQVIDEEGNKVYSYKYGGSNKIENSISNISKQLLD